MAQQLGFTKDQVKWIVVPFNSSYAPGTKKFDFDINQISISPKRAEHVDFSTPYFTAPQAVVATKGSPAANATSLADLAKAKLGVQLGTTSYDAVNAVDQAAQAAADLQRLQRHRPRAEDQERRRDRRRPADRVST